MNRKLKAAFGLSALALATSAAAQITFYEGEDFRGRSFTTDKRVWNFERFGFNDRASSVVIDRGRWEVCESPRFEGRCVVLRRGSYDSLRRMGLNNQISSVRPVERNGRYSSEAPEPLAAPTNEFRRRPNERLYEAPVTSVRAVMGPPEQRCWVEREQVTERRADAGGALAGALIGGILGHQIGEGRNRDLATAGGAVAGAAIGSQVGPGAGPVTHERDVRRCTQAVSGTPQYYDVTYSFRGVAHRAQMTAPPGRTITVNEAGVPRG
jgi:uncharacterized protein YcfJ